MLDLKEKPIACHIVCKSNEAYQKLEALCAEYGNDLYIDWEQSQASYEWEMKAENDRLAHYGETFQRNKINKGDS